MGNLTPVAHHWFLIRTFCFLLFAGCTFFVNRRMARGEISFSLGMVWSTAFLVAMVFAFFPATLFYVSRVSGTVLPSNILFFSAIVFLSVLVFGLTLKISFQNQKVLRLTQELAIMKLDWDSQLGIAKPLKNGGG